MLLRHIQRRPTTPTHPPPTVVNLICSSCGSCGGRKTRTDEVIREGVYEIAHAQDTCSSSARGGHLLQWQTQLGVDTCSSKWARSGHLLKRTVAQICNLLTCPTWTLLKWTLDTLMVVVVFARGVGVGARRCNNRSKSRSRSMMRNMRRSETETGDMSYANPGY